MTKIKSNEILGGAILVVGVAIIAGLGPKPGPIDRYTIGAAIMALGVGASFGRSTFLAVIGKLLEARKDRESSDRSDGET